MQRIEKTTPLTKRERPRQKLVVTRLSTNYRHMFLRVYQVTEVGRRIDVGVGNIRDILSLLQGVTILLLHFHRGLAYLASSEVSKSQRQQNRHYSSYVP